MLANLEFRHGALMQHVTSRRYASPRPGGTYASEAIASSALGDLCCAAQFATRPGVNQIKVGR